MYQNFTRGHTAAQKQVAQITSMLHFLIMHSPKLCKKVQHTGKDRRHIRMHQLAVRRCQYVVSAAFLVQTKRKRTIFIFISKGKFHLITVTKFNRTSVDSFPVKVCINTYCLLEKSFHLSFLHF